MKLLDFKIYVGYHQAVIVDLNEKNIGHCCIFEQADDFDLNGKRIPRDVRKHFTRIRFHENMKSFYVGTYLSYEEAVFAVNEWIENNKDMINNRK